MKRMTVLAGVTLAALVIRMAPAHAAPDTDGSVYVNAAAVTGFSAGERWHDNFCRGADWCLTGDFNGDGRKDIVRFEQGDGADVYVALNQGLGFADTGYKWHEFFSPAGEMPAVGDVNHDGKDDIITFARSRGEVFVAVSNGARFVGTSQNWLTGFARGNATPAVGDFNGDGCADVLYFSNDGNADVYVSLSTGSSFTSPRQWHGDFSRVGETPSVGDFNGDGRDDVVTFAGGNNATVYVALALPSGRFGEATRWHDWFAPWPEVPSVGDFNGDGKDDIVTISPTGDTYVALADPTHSQFYGLGWVWARGLSDTNDQWVVADVTGDNKADIVNFWSNGLRPVP